MREGYLIARKSLDRPTLHYSHEKHDPVSGIVTDHRVFTHEQTMRSPGLLLAVILGHDGFCPRYAWGYGPLQQLPHRSRHRGGALQVTDFGIKSAESRNSNLTMPM